MSRKGQLFIVISMLALVALEARAQLDSSDKKNEVAVMVERDFASGHAITSPAIPPPLTDNRVNIGRGLAFQ